MNQGLSLIGFLTLRLAMMKTSMDTRKDKVSEAYRQVGGEGM